MPIYEYVCNACSYTFERIQSFNDDPVSRCPSCKGNVRRVISSVGVIFKGSGWYITDNRRQIASSGGNSPQLSDQGGRGEQDSIADGDKSAKAGDGTGKDKGTGKERGESGRKDKGRDESGPKDKGRDESGPRDKKPSRDKKGASPKTTD